MKYLRTVKMAFYELDNIFQGWKIFFSLAMVLVALYVMPEGKAQYIVATASVGLGLIARASKLYNEKKGGE